MKKILLLGGLLFTLKILHAQTGKFTLAAGIGANQPVGVFGQKNITQANAGFAKTGLCANITATRMLAKTFGLTALLAVQDNGVDTKSIAHQVNAQTQDPAFTQQSVTSKHWQAAKLLAGGTIVLPFAGTGKWLFTARALGGVLKTRLPQQSGLVISTRTNVGNTFAKYAERNKLSLPCTFAAMGGAGVQYNIVKKVFLQCNVDYTYAAPQSKYADFLQFGGGVFGSSTPIPLPADNPYQHRQGMCSISLTVGAGIKL